MSFPFYRQLNAMDCGPTCLRMIAKYYGKHFNGDTLRRMTGFSKSGTSMLGISTAAEKIGFRTRGVQLNISSLQLVRLPAILHWDQNHFVVLVSIKRNKAVVADPKNSIITYSIEEFLSHWVSKQTQDNGGVGSVLLLEPSPLFYENEGEKDSVLNWDNVIHYLKPNRGRLLQVLFTLLISSLLQLAFPFLTQSMVDQGINAQNLQYVTIVLVAQLMLLVSSTMIGFIRSRLQLRISNSINISILSDFLIKLTRLPLYYFEVHRTGDTMQRLGDNRLIQSFITGKALNSIFSILNFLIYSFILIWYSVSLFIVFSIGNGLYFLWIQLFMRIRRKLNYQTFHLMAKENNATLQLVQGMQEIRLNGGEHLKRWDWENIQASVFKVNFRSLNYSQWQSAGALFINQGKDIFISFMVAGLVIKGELTLGTMLAVQYIIGQLSAPVMEFINLSQSIQDAKISMERLNEVHQINDEEPRNKVFQNKIPESGNLVFHNLSFGYPGAENTSVLKHVSLDLPRGRVTAIVGASGSGKTTILKLLLKVYESYEGKIEIGLSNLKHISSSAWREACGAVMQDGFIFSESIARNIVVGEEEIDLDRLIESCRTSNILSFIESTPNGFNTMLGTEGVGLSQGQKQRLLIARAVYKDPQFLFFDEATNALDANNEKEIVENLRAIFEGRTVLIIAHRLSTVKHADKIVVLNNGEIVEEGTHDQLVALDGQYYRLVKNQLELGS